MFNNIVIPLDLSDKQSVKIIFPKAISLAKAFEAKLHLVYIMPDFGMKMLEDYLPRNWMRDQKEKYKILFEKIIKQYVSNDIHVIFYIGRGAIYDEVINYSEKVQADLIMLSAVRFKLKDYMLGPNASKIVRHSSVSVMVVRD